jgi:hypothetical protein
VVLAALCGGGALGCADATSSPSTTPEVRLPTTAELDDSAQRANADAPLAHARVFFGHQSVGQSLVDALPRLPAAVRAGLSARAIAPDETRAWEEGELRHARVGRNEDPASKIRAFESAFDGGAGDGAQLALFKFCYVDFTSDTDVDDLIAKYRAALSRLEKSHPDTVFLHTTAPLTVRGSWVRRALARVRGKPTLDDVNAVRERYNDALRRAFPKERIFDLAAFEAACGEDGRGDGHPAALASACSTDGGHLTDDAAARIAAQLLRTLAAAAG